MGTKPTPHAAKKCPPTHPQTIRSPRKTLIDERRKQTMLARVGKKSRAGGENSIFDPTRPHAVVMDLSHFQIQNRSSHVIYRRSTHQRSPVTLSPPKGGESVTGSLSILFSGSLFCEAGTMFRGFGAPGGIHPLGSGCVGAWVHECVGV